MNTYTNFENKGWVCPNCGKGKAPYVSECDCTKYSSYTFPNYPITPPTLNIPERKCLFDGLPPGVYGLYCGCPKCSPQCFDSEFWR